MNVDQDAILRLLKENLKQRQSKKIRIKNFTADNLEFPDNSFDTVISTLVPGSVDSPTATLQEIKRVLKPKGKFYFLEHVLAVEKPHLVKWQKFFQPFW